MRPNSQPAATSAEADDTEFLLEAAGLEGNLNGASTSGCSLHARLQTRPFSWECRTGCLLPLLLTRE